MPGILILDDDPDVALAARLVLRKLGSVVVRNDGMRDLYVFDSPKSEPTVIELSEDQARKVAAVLSATFFDA